MSEHANKKLEEIGQKLNGLPQEVAADALSRYADRLEGYAEGFAAGTAYAQKSPA